MCVIRSQSLSSIVALSIFAITIGWLTGGLDSQHAFAQTRTPQSQSSQSTAGKATAKLPRPAPNQMRLANLDPMLKRILEIWEWHGGKTQKMEGVHQRIIYDKTFKVMKLAKGEFYYEAPDRGRIDIRAVKVPDPPKNKVKAYGTIFTQQSDTPEAWLCDGEKITMVNLSRKEFQTVVIPPANRGQNIVDGPLPFLFGMKAAQAVKRYKMSLGKQNNPQKGVVHVVALPLWKQDAQQWSKAEVILNSKTFLPMAIQLTHPDGKDITVYKFSDVERNKKNRGVFALWKKDPFKPSLKGYKELKAVAQKPGTPRTQTK